MAAEVIGWDIGGAHLKAARVDAQGRLQQVVQRPSPVWRGMVELDRAFDALAAAIGHAGEHAVTMTAESADVFPDRAFGVRAVCEWAADRLSGARVTFFDRIAGLISPELAAKRSASVGSANWAATAAWVSTRLNDAVVVDVGSTTTDVVPIVAGRCTAVGVSDYSRLVAQELVYSGVVRTPVMAVAQAIRLADTRVPLCAEVFATTGDVYRLLGRLDPENDQADTADGRGRGRRDSAARLARMIGLDAGEVEMPSLDDCARQLAAAQADVLVQAWRAVAARHLPLARAPIVALGAGAFLAEDLAGRIGVGLVRFADLVPVARGGTAARGAAVAGPAVAVALLAQAPRGQAGDSAEVAVREGVRPLVPSGTRESDGCGS